MSAPRPPGSFAAERTKQALLEALVGGRASVSANPFNPRVELVAGTQANGEMNLMMGDNARADGQAVDFEIRLIGGGIKGAQYKVRIIKNREEFGTLITDAVTQTARFSDTPESGERSYYRVEIEGPQTPYPEVPNCMAQSQNMVALSNPIYFNYDPDF